MIALPHKPMIRMEAPSFVNFPSPSKANGHIPAQISELGNPSNTTNHMDISVVCPSKVTRPCVKIIISVNIMPNNVHTRNAFT